MQDKYGQQNRKCAICKADKKLKIDRDYTTGKIRGLLCNSCSNAIGLFKGNPQLCIAAIKYLNKAYPQIKGPLIKPILDNNLIAKLANVFTKKQIELIVKKISQFPMTRSEKEYFSKVVKKKLIAFAHPDIYDTAQKALLAL